MISSLGYSRRWWFNLVECAGSPPSSSPSPSYHSPKNRPLPSLTPPLPPPRSSPPPRLLSSCWSPGAHREHLQSSSPYHSLSVVRTGWVVVGQVRVSHRRVAQHRLDRHPKVSRRRLLWAAECPRWSSVRAVPREPRCSTIGFRVCLPEHNNG